MTVVNYETGEIVERLDRDEAERLSNRIALRLDSIADNYEAVVPMIRESVEREAWAALGYRSPGEYAADRFGGALSRLGVEFRQAVTRELAEMGMSTRAIAGVVGVSKDTVHRDLGGVSRETPGPTTGIDGKTYSRPEPRPETSREAPDESYRALSQDDGDAEALSSNEGDAPLDSDTPTFRPAESAEPELADLDDAGPNVQPETGSQPPTPSPRVAPAIEGEYASALQSCWSLTRAVGKLLEFQHPNMRDGIRRYWSLASDEVSPVQRADVTPELMRIAAHGLLTLADEWSSQ